MPVVDTEITFLPLYKKISSTGEIGLIGKKIGMSREFYKTGQSVPAVSYTHLTLPTNREV